MAKVSLNSSIEQVRKPVSEPLFRDQPGSLAL